MTDYNSVKRSTENTAGDFYLNNFQILADFVYTHYRQLLSDEERGFFLKLNSLPDPSRLLCIRLLMRRGEYIRLSKINYAELPSVSVCCRHLLAEGLLRKAEPDRAPDWLHLFSKDELASVNASAFTDDSELISAPDLLGDTPLALLQQLDTVYLVSCKAHYQVYLLLFFGNTHQDLSEFILRDLGVRDYENYLTDTTALPFTSREHLLAYIHYYQCLETFEDAVTQGADALFDLFLSIPDNHFNDPTLKRRQHKLYNEIARQLERENALDKAAEIYGISDFPPARERLARVEAARGNDDAAHRICSTILIHPANSEEQEFAARFHHRLSKRLGLNSTPPTLYKPPEITLSLASLRLPVEYATALHFAKSGHCYYVENSLITAAFGLAFWDIIFAPLDGVFFNPFQRAPLDFYDREFINRRHDMIAERLTSITSGRLRNHLFTHFHRKHGIVNPLVSWSAVSYPLLALTLTRIPDEDWRSIFEYLLSDLQNHRSGLPDLVYFPDTGGYQFLEVKGPGDSLQQHQRRWMHHFSRHNIPHALVNVQYRRRTVKEQPLTALSAS